MFVVQLISSTLTQAPRYDYLRSLKNCNTSVNHLSAVFNQTVGMSVHQFVMYQRIEKAKILLKDSQKSLIEISFELGFSSQAHFTTSFRKACGVTPYRFRQAL